MRRIRAGVVVAGLVLATAAAGCRRGDEDPSVLLLVTVDGVRPDRVAAGGDAAGTAPHLDALGERGVVFAVARTPVPHSRGALATLATGLAPVRHQLRFDDHVLFEAHETLAERVQAEGWTTAAFVPEASLVGAAGFGQGFAIREGFDDLGEDALVERACRWLEGGAAAERRFAWVHFDAPTAPYLPPGGDPDDGFSFFEVDARGRPRNPANRRLHEHARSLVVFGRKPLPAAERARAIALKDAEVAAFDARLGRLVGAAGEAAVVVVAGTHGESLGEHGYWFDHGEDVFDASLRVPLVVRAPSVPSSRVDAPVDLADVAPTVLTLLGLGPLEGATGRSAAAALRGGAFEARPLFAQSGPPVAWRGHPRFDELPLQEASAKARERAFLSPEHRLRAVSMPSGRKFVLDPIDGRLRAFDVRADPGETSDRAEDPAWAEDVRRARELLETVVVLERARLAAVAGRAPPALPPLERAIVGQLREAGYLDE